MNTTYSPGTAVNLGPAARIPLGEGRRFAVAGHDVAVFRTRDWKVYAVQATCPHRGGPLADGLVGDGRVVCPLHGFAFEVESGRPTSPACEWLRTYPIELTAEGEMILHL